RSVSAARARSSSVTLCDPPGSFIRSTWRPLLSATCAAGAARGHSFVASRCCLRGRRAVELRPLDSSPGQRLEDEPVKLAAKNAPALELGFRQPGQLLVQGGCRVGVGAGFDKLDDACTEPLGVLACVAEGPADRVSGNL